MSNIGERIFKIKSYYFGDERGSNKKFADVVGEKPNTVSNWFGRKDGIGDAVIDKILSTFPNVDKGWLVGGNGDMLTSTESPSLAQAIDNESDLKSALKKGIKLLPEVDFKFAAGQIELINGIESIKRYWYLPDCKDCEAIVSLLISDWAQRSNPSHGGSLSYIHNKQRHRSLLRYLYIE